MDGYGEQVTAAAHHPEHHEPGELDSPRAIRDALLPEERGEFDAAYKQALADAGEKLDLADVFETLASWQRIALQTRVDPDAHRAMLQQAERTLATGEPPVGAVPLADVRELLRRR
jgi:hypothetical protein